jgi:hypothetical protein
MAFMRVTLDELLHQAAMGQILVLEYMLPGMRGFLRVHPIMLGA